MVRSEVDSVVRNMTLTNGLVWSIPIVFDVSRDTWSECGVSQGDSVLLTYQDQPLAVLEVVEAFSYDRDFMAQQVYGTADRAHPGVMRTLGLLRLAPG